MLPIIFIDVCIRYLDIFYNKLNMIIVCFGIHAAVTFGICWVGLGYLCRSPLILS
jgi:hypothetical protein